MNTRFVGNEQQAVNICYLLLPNKQKPGISRFSLVAVLKISATTTATATKWEKKDGEANWTDNHIS